MNEKPTWASASPKLMGELFPGMGMILAPKAGSSLLAQCKYMSITGKEFEHPVEHLVHVELERMSRQGKLRKDGEPGGWFCDYEDLSTVGVYCMVWRSPAKRIASAVRMFLDRSVDGEFKITWWQKWLPQFEPFSKEGMLWAVSMAAAGKFHEKHFLPYFRLFQHTRCQPETLIPLSLLVEWLATIGVRLPTQTIRNECSEYGKSIDLRSFNDVLEVVQIMDNKFLETRINKENGVFMGQCINWKDYGYHE